MNGHTAGQWEADGATTPGGLGRRYQEIFAVGEGRSYAIAHTADRDQTIGSDEDEQNARLIAAAPELADALDSLVMYYTSDSPPGDAVRELRRRIDLAKATLRKAGRLP